MVDINQENSKIVIVSTAIVIFMGGVGNAILIYEMLVSVCLYVCLCVCYADLSAFLTLFDVSLEPANRMQFHTIMADSAIAVPISTFWVSNSMYSSC